jgi:hypothetical protein
MDLSQSYDQQKQWKQKLDERARNLGLRILPSGTGEPSDPTFLIERRDIGEFLAGCQNLSLAEVAEKLKEMET